MGEIEYGEPWGLLANLTSLQELSVRVRADGGDPSQLSALMGLSTLKLYSLRRFGAFAADGPAPYSFSSLQPLSTLRYLGELHLGVVPVLPPPGLGRVEQSSVASA
jgi:hypothetical protein